MILGFELKAAVVVLLILTIIWNISTYKEVSTKNGFMPKPQFWILCMVSSILFVYSLYLNEQLPIILF